MAEDYQAKSAPVGINAFGVAARFPESKTPSAQDVKKAILAAVEAIPEEKLRNLKNLNNGRLTVIV